ncbi:hypothetical protein ACOSQ3_021561 [Xanthoceras sorbifolium]
MPTPVLAGKVPFSMLFGTAPDYLSLRVFGCLVFPYIRPYAKHKLQLRSSPCTFLGYDTQFKGYKCLDSTGRIFVVRHIVFNEIMFPFASSVMAPSAPPTASAIQLFPPIVCLSTAPTLVLRQPSSTAPALPFSSVTVLLHTGQISTVFPPIVSNESSVFSFPAESVSSLPV